MCIRDRVDTGSGSREDPWAGNSDTMILVTVNPQTKETTMTSLERDILTNITSCLLYTSYQTD